MSSHRTRASSCESSSSRLRSAAGPSEHAGSLRGFLQSGLFTRMASSRPLPPPAKSRTRPSGPALPLLFTSQGVASSETFWDSPAPNWVPSYCFCPSALLFFFTDPGAICNYWMSCTVIAGPPPITHLSGEAPGLFSHQLKSTFGEGLLSDSVPPCTCGPHEPHARGGTLWAPRAPDGEGPGDVGGTPFCHCHLPVRKVRLGEIKPFSQGHTASKGHVRAGPTVTWAPGLVYHPTWRPRQAGHQGVGTVVQPLWETIFQMLRRVIHGPRFHS